MFKSLRDEIDGIMARDPAARSWLEVVLCYPGFQALAFYRMANWLWRHGFHLGGRWVSHLGRVLTGIEIHPGARIGRNLFIDHGMGVVIGETAEIGDDVTLYHGVTLGGISPSENSDEQRNRKRHPTLGDRVIVGSGAQILGPFEVGECARIGANAVVTKPVPARVTMVGNPAKQLPMRDQPHEAEPRFLAYGTPTGDIPDPVARALDGLLQEVQGLRARVHELEAQQHEGRGALPPHGEEQESEREEARQSRAEGKC